MRTELRKRFAFGSLVALMVCALSLITSSQDTLDSVLRPPKGSQVAIVVFEDLECPMCRRTAPLVEQASKTYKIPVIRHDFPLPMHPWSYQAAVMARYFDTFSKSMGNDFRDYIFENQLEVNIQNLKSFADKFAAAHKTSMYRSCWIPTGSFARRSECGSRPRQGSPARPHSNSLHREQPKSQSALRRSERQ